jgi:hypothetical protein
LNLSEYNEKIQEIVNNYNEIKNKLYENYIQKYAELFFSSNELENINIIKLIKNGRFSRCEYFGDRWLRSKEKNWTKVTIFILSFSFEISKKLIDFQSQFENIKRNILCIKSIS